MLKTYTGTPGDNVFHANSLDTWIMKGRGGNDDLGGHNLADQLYGGGTAGADLTNTGKDLLYGYGGNDYIFGQDGNDRIYGGSENDFIDGGQGADYLYGETGNDRMYGQGGNDWMDGGAGNDRMFGGTRDDQLTGGVGNDILYGGSGVDRLFGQGNDDFIYGQGGNDLLLGNAGSDFLDGGLGTDNLYGGAGAGVDRFQYSDNGGTDRIKDFTNGSDKIVVNVDGFDSYADIAPVKSGYNDGGIASTLIHFGGTQYLIIQNVNPISITAADFIFV